MKFDGINKPRPVQQQILDWLTDNWDSADVLAVQAPTGIGKSALMKAVADVVITPSNHLIDQYQQTYEEINILKGAEHYKCGKAGDCETHRLLFKRSCPSCPYSEAKKRVKEGEQTFANPLSYYYLTMDSKFRPPKILGIDEADRLEDMLSMAATLELSHKNEIVPRVDTAVALLPWLEIRANQALSKHEYGKAGNYKRVAQLVEMNPKNYRIVQTQESTLLFPIEVSSQFMQRVTRCKKLILMSATLFESDVKRIAGSREYKYLQVDSPIPVESRRIIYRPIPCDKKPTRDGIVTWLREVEREYQSKGTIAHVTYRMQSSLKRFFPKALTNTRKNKQQIIKKLAANGGMWLASGCHEGIDLRDDIARLNLIPVLPFDNLGDPVVEARLEKDRDRYTLDMLRKVIQMAGRTTRGPDDYSTVIIGDPRFPRVVNRYKKELPKSFIESIVWRERK